MIKHPNITNRRSFKPKPIVIYNAMYNYSALTELNMQQRMDFFFNKNSHPLLQSSFSDIIDKNVLSKNAMTSDEFTKKSNEIVKNNIECMLQLLFLASPLNSITATGSYEVVTKGIVFPNLPTTYGFFNGVSTSQIEINSKLYSFDRLIWLNDILNCPVYQELLNKYINFRNWLIDTRAKKIVTSDVSKADEEPVKEALAKLQETIDVRYIDFMDLYKIHLLYYLLSPTAVSKPENAKKLEEFINVKIKKADDDVKKFAEFKKLMEERIAMEASPAAPASVDKVAKTKEIKSFFNELQKDNPKLYEYLEVRIMSLFNEFLNQKSGKKTVNDLTTELNKPYVSQYGNLVDEYNKASHSNFHKNALADTIASMKPDANNPDHLAKFDELNKEYLKNGKIYENAKGRFDKVLHSLVEKYFKDAKFKLLLTDNSNKNLVENVSDFNERINDYLVFSNTVVKQSKEKSTRNDDLKYILENIDKKTYDNMKEEIGKKLKMTLYYRQPGESVDFVIYHDFMFNYINRDLSIENISSNEFLQTLLTMKTDKDAERFFSFLDQTYRHFYLGESDISIQKPLLFTGMNYKRQTGTYEIHVMADIFAGDHDSMYGKQNCAIKNEYLGKNLELLISKNAVGVGAIGIEKNRQNWDVRYHRVVYSLPDETSEKTDVQNAKPIAPVAKKEGEIIKADEIKSISASDRNIAFQIIEQVERESKQEASNHKPDPKSSDNKYWQFDKSKSLIENVNVHDGGRLNASNLLDKLLSGDDNDKKLFSAIFEYMKDLNVFSQIKSNSDKDKIIAKIQKFNTLKREFQGLIENIVTRQKLNSEVITQKDIFELNILCATYYLYVKILEKLIKLENDLVATYGGLKRRKKYRTKKIRLSKKRFTRKNKHSLKMNL
jgi:hypothetical protein